ncbi:MAG: peroxiredoxin [Alphaproteobacteria bacterium]|nr:peroxiredoxin [Alphaproteobacteria bacterium]
MTIKTGDTLPSLTLKRMGASGLEEFNTLDAVKGKKVVIFGVPGAFTPSCAQKHLPGYVKEADAIKAKGIAEIICVAVNDPFVMAHWADVAGTQGKVTMWPDGNGAFADALGLTFDGAGAGLGKRLQRFSMVVDNGVVASLDIEAKPSDVELSGAQACLVKLG